MCGRGSGSVYYYGKGSIALENFELIDRGDSWLELRFQQPDSKANVFTARALQELGSVLDDLEKRTDVKGLIITSSKETVYVAGADISLIQSLDSFEKAVKKCTSGQQTITRISHLPFETVAAIGGICLGGGFELALACKKRVVSDSKNVKIGLPEVQLGILPGFGGSIRLPRVVKDLTTALDLILTGKQINGKKAWKVDIASAVLPAEDFNERALVWAKKNHGKPPKKTRKGLGAFLLHTFIGRILIFGMARKNVQKKTKGRYPAPLAILNLLGKTYGSSNMKWCLQQEVRAFADLVITPESKRLIELFLLTESVRKNTVKGSSPVSSVGVLGAGIMGGGIAHAFAKVKIPVRMKDITYEALSLGYEQSAKNFSFGLKRRRITPREFNQSMGFISGGVDYKGFSSTGVVVEAIVENMDIKKKVLQETEKHISSDCIFASNTSSLSITELQSVAKRPEKVAGLHFFNPVNRMPLVEVIAGEKTSDETVATLYELSKRLQKTPIVVKNCAGFLVNRLLLPYLNEACFLLEQGVSIERVDRIMVKFGMPMGPLRLVDEVGIDTAAKVAKVLYEAYGERAKASSLTDTLASSGRLGRKNKKGFYRWDGNKAVGVDDTIYEHINSKNASLSDKDILDRMLCTMINEAAIILQEGIVKTPQEVDLGLIMGTGFPPFRGGLLRYADAVGLDKIKKSLNRFYEEGLGERFSISPALSEYTSSFYR